MSAHRSIGLGQAASPTLGAMNWTGVPACKLSATQRRVVWEHIKAHHPQLAAELSGPVAAELREQFGASPVFERSLIAAAEREAAPE